MSSTVDAWTQSRTGARNAVALMEYQLRRVNEVIGYVQARSAFYKERLAGISGEITDMAGLPFTYPEDVMHSSAKMLCIRQNEVSRVVTHRTSGTSARAKRVYFAQSDQEATVEFFLHGMSEFTREADTVLILFPGETEGSIGRLLAQGLRRLGAEPVVYGIGIAADFDALIGFIDRNTVNVIAGLPQQVLELSRLCRQRRVDTSPTHSVLLSADYVAGAVVKAIEADLGCTVYEHYGMTEMCFGGGVYSQAREGYHLRHADFLFEVVDPETGAVLPMGEYGEIVFTSLNAGAMPLIRYRTGDIARFSPQAHKYPLLERIVGRAADARLADGVITTARLDEVLFGIEGVLDYSAGLTDNALTLRVRALDFNSDEIYAALNRSRLCERLDAVSVLPTDRRSTGGNTMNKRVIER